MHLLAYLTITNTPVYISGKTLPVEHLSYPFKIVLLSTATWLSNFAVTRHMLPNDKGEVPVLAPLPIRIAHFPHPGTQSKFLLLVFQSQFQIFHVPQGLKLNSLVSIPVIIQ